MRGRLPLPGWTRAFVYWVCFQILPLGLGAGDSFCPYWRFSVFKSLLRYPYLIWLMGSLIFSLKLQAFDYGQCLLDRSDSFSQQLRHYRNISLARASIKKLALQENEDLLRWNYDTARLVYDLQIVKPLLSRLEDLYRPLRVSNPDGIQAIQEYLSTESGHFLLDQIDHRQGEVNSEEKTKEDYLQFLSEVLGPSPEEKTQLEEIRKLISNPSMGQALGDFYDRIQNASVGATPLEPDSVQEWIALSDFFQQPASILGCSGCQEKINLFQRALSKWVSERNFPSEDLYWKRIYPNLPPLFKMQYPKLEGSHKNANLLVRYYYTRTVENFLFNKETLEEQDIVRWMKNDANYKVILKQADSDPNTYYERHITQRILKYLRGAERVYHNAFDHFVWNSQEGSEFEKTVDGVARTLYGEAESCQADGAHQFEAIAAVIAARSVSVDQDNRDNNILKSMLDYAMSAVQILSPVEMAPLSNYHRGASDFGRDREILDNPSVAEMLTPARVVSQPNQFSVWKVGGNEDFEVTRWIHWPSGAGYPADLSVSIVDASTFNLDNAQKKVLCPNSEMFPRALEVAKELVNDYYAFANRYRFYQGNKRVVPYFFSHGPSVTVGVGKPILPNPRFYEITADLTESKAGRTSELPVFDGTINCRTFKVYTPVAAKMEKPKAPPLEKGVKSKNEKLAVKPKQGVLTLGPKVSEKQTAKTQSPKIKELKALKESTLVGKKAKEVTVKGPPLKNSKSSLAKSTARK